MKVLVLPSFVFYMLCCCDGIKEITLCRSARHQILHSSVQNVALGHFSTTMQLVAIKLFFVPCSYLNVPPSSWKIKWFKL